jgi:hypothetical protein
LAPGIATAAPIVAGDRVVLTDGPGNTGGGEFNMFVNGSATSFITFCLQRTQFISFGTPFVVGSVTNYADDLPANDLISSQTAWLYTQVRNGLLVGYTHTQAAANALQYAIWYFENEISLSNPDSNQFIKAANQAVANGFTGIGNVRVVNLFDLHGNRAQDQLIMYGGGGSGGEVPGPASLTLLGLGLAAFGWFRHRVRP